MGSQDVTRGQSPAGTGSCRETSCTSPPRRVLPALTAGHLPQRTRSVQSLNQETQAFQEVVIRGAPLKTGLVCKVCQQGITDTQHEPCTDVVELGAHNV